MSAMSPKYPTTAGPGQSLLDDACHLTDNLLSGFYVCNSLQQLLPTLKSIITSAGIGAALTTYFISRRTGPIFQDLGKSVETANDRKLDMAIFHILKVLRLRPDFEDLVLNQTDKLVEIVKGLIDEMYEAYLVQAEEKERLSGFVGTELRIIHHNRRKRLRGSDVTNLGFGGETIPAPKRQRYEYTRNGDLAPPNGELLRPAPLASKSINFEPQEVATPGPQKYLFIKENPSWLQDFLDESVATADEKRRVAAAVPPPTFRTLPLLEGHKPAAPAPTPERDTTVPDPHPSSSNKKIRNRRQRGLRGKASYSERHGGNGHNIDLSSHSSDSSDRKFGKARLPLKRKAYQAYVSKGSEESEEVVLVPSPPVTRSQTRPFESFGSPPDLKSKVPPTPSDPVFDPWDRGAGPRGTLAAARRQINAQTEEQPRNDRFAARKAGESERLLFGKLAKPIKAGSGTGILNMDALKSPRYAGKVKGTDLPATHGRQLSVIDEEPGSTDSRPVHSLAVIDSFLDEFDRNQVEVDAVARELEASIPEHEKMKHTQQPSNDGLATARRKSSSSTSRKSHRKPSSSASRKSSATWSSSSRKSSGVSKVSYPLSSLYPEYDTIFTDPFTEEDIQRQLNESYPSSRRSSSSRKSSKSQQDLLPDDLIDAFDLEEMPPPPSKCATYEAPRIFDPEPDDDLWLEALPSNDHRSPRVTKKRGRPSISPPQPGKSIKSQRPFTKSSGALRRLKMRAISAPPTTNTNKRGVTRSKKSTRRRSAASYISSSLDSSSGEDPHLSYTQALRRGSGITPTVKTFTRFGPRRSSRIRDVVDLHRGDLNENRLYKKAWRRGSQ